MSPPRAPLYTRAREPSTILPGSAPNDVTPPVRRILSGSRAGARTVRPDRLTTLVGDASWRHSIRASGCRAGGAAPDARQLSWVGGSRDPEVDAASRRGRVR